MKPSKAENTTILVKKKYKGRGALFLFKLVGSVLFEARRCLVSGEPVRAGIESIQRGCFIY
jgi:hypothetical protein